VEEILIKKYENRRLYCVNEAKYVSLTDIKTMIADGKTVRVVEKNGGKDITKYILMQVLLEDKYDVMPEFFLKMLIQSPVSFLEPFFNNFFPQMLEYYIKMKESQAQNPFAGFQNMMFPQQQQNPFAGFQNMMPNYTGAMEEIMKRLMDLENKIKK